MTIVEGIILMIAGVFVGFINTVAGGGSLLTVPLMIFMGLPSVEANGTNRVALLFQNIAALAGFRSKGVSFFPLGLYLAIPAIIGALLGARLAIDIKDDVFNKILAIIMLLVMGITMLKPLFAKRTQNINEPKKMCMSIIIFFFLGVYGGFIQAGIGFFIIASLTYVFKLDMARTNSIKVFVIFCYTCVALIVFFVNDKIRWEFGLTLAIGNVLGAWLASRWSVNKSDHLIKMILLFMVVCFSIKLWFF